jgi:hypothetical protein
MHGRARSLDAAFASGKRFLGGAGARYAASWSCGTETT